MKVGRDLISRVTDAVMDDVREWQQRPLDDVYPVVFSCCVDGPISTSADRPATFTFKNVPPRRSPDVSQHPS